MKKKKPHDDSMLLANTRGQSLKEHSLAVALYGHLFLRSLKFKSSIEKELNQYLIRSALLHDTGKVSSDFQQYIKKQINKDLVHDMPEDAEGFRPKSFKGPYHNEISWAYAENFIDFDNPKTKEAVYHSVYWHHPANWDEKQNKLRFENSQTVFENSVSSKQNTEKLLNRMYEFISDLLFSFSSYYENDFSRQCLKPDKNKIKRIQTPNFFTHELNGTAENSNKIINSKKQLCLNLLLEADREISSWDPDKLKSFLKEWKSWIPKTHKNSSSLDPDKLKGFLIKWKSQTLKSYKKKKILVSENLSTSPKSKEQYALAKKMAYKKLSVCGVDPAGGKTSITLYWWNCLNNEYPLMAALPKQHQVTGLYKSLEEDCQRIYGRKINTEGVFNGKRQYQNWETDESDLLTSDINILVFDRFLSPYYKRSQSSEFLKMLQSHLVLDEFHEFKAVPKMIPALKEILEIRSWLESGVKTLMLSGTPEPSLLNLLSVEKSDVFRRVKLSPRENHKFKISFEEKNSVYDNQFIPDCLYSFLRVESCQKVFSNLFKLYQDKIKLIHSYFTVKDKTELLNQILREHGKLSDKPLSDKSTITAKMLQSSYNLSFNKAILEVSLPYTDCQTAGRVNRFENKSDAEMHFIFDGKTVDFFKEISEESKEIHKSWKEHILSFIKMHKKQTVSIRKLMECYDSFWDCENNISESLKALKALQKEAVKDLNQYIPKRFSLSKSKNKNLSYLNSLFRGESRCLSASVVDDQGNPENQLCDEDLLSESRDWLIKKIENAMKQCLKSNKKCMQANKINDQETFEYNKYTHRGFGFKIERPLLSSHFNQEIDQCLKKALYDEDQEKTEYRVYHEKFGLVKKNLLKNGS